jgi:hypothetical protein
MRKHGRQSAEAALGDPLAPSAGAFALGPISISLRAHSVGLPTRVSRLTFAFTARRELRPETRPSGRPFLRFGHPSGPRPSSRPTAFALRLMLIGLSR